ncbi:MULTISPECIES: helix-turn-helix transcriptional regulator [Saccharopolyspora]|uniref:Helix-turn-helix transcriptional regulator n=1 Tax=Saccharopolyspora gregorii TaxID=33914 RepID=A0ABP6RZU3_9PSEU|nr:MULTISPECIES: helix-turn-helix transcriptional regulator [unclassified Saccharopolyspora]MCA1186656.1 helix-turn-helix transcriptional regulator [Saccharopolyspora sp. 6T]MCA1191780.1 helix-turn-helix transcriptional regulator [Saccharopolyspora sp. 6V]MCA1227329.1 helix-turn-helix transcriptional regulator [Saccharopolyspora sp. 6M]MCA1281167.1 helix-turn-helix transcriptional regulator [Saccharopolyspora sp. 7B]
MNTIGSNGSPVTRDVWDGREMRDALAARNVSEIYRQLRRIGVSQRQIAASTGQSQSEVSEILKGRQVMAYDVLARIADGLGIPRGYMGLAYDGATAMRVAKSNSGPQAEEDESVKRRKFLSHAAAVTMGAAVFGTEESTWVPSNVQTPAPMRIGMTDVQQIQAATKALRDLDYRYGGGTCRDAVVAQLSWAQQLLDANASDQVKRKLYVSLADMHSLAGWTSFDTGLLDPARGHFGKALEFAKQAEDDSLVASVLYRMGRVYLHYQEPNEALKLFQLGQIAAQESGSSLTVAVLCANEAWAYGMLNKPDQVQKMVGRTKDEFARANVAEAPDWVRFFNENDLHGMIGSAHDALAVFDPDRYAPLAVAETIKCNEAYGADMQRTHVFGLSLQATNHIRAGDLQEGIKVGRSALQIGEKVKSARVADRLKPLELEAGRHRMNSDARDLSEEIRRFREA